MTSSYFQSKKELLIVDVEKKKVSITSIASSPYHNRFLSLSQSLPLPITIASYRFLSLPPLYSFLPITIVSPHYSLPLQLLQASYKSYTLQVHFRIGSTCISLIVTKLKYLILELPTSQIMSKAVRLLKAYSHR